MNEVSSNIAALAGGVSIEVEYLDGKKESVLIREIPLREYPFLLKALDNEDRQAEIFCGKPEGWAASLRPVSHDAIIEKGDELNRLPFSNWFGRRTARTEMVAPGKLKELTNQALKAASAGS